MTDNFYKKASYLIGLLPLGALFGLVAFVANLEIKDLDIWLHLGVGKYITLTKQVPVEDFLSHTMSGKLWNNHEWLFQILVYNIFNFWGVDGLLKMQIIVVTITMLFLLFIGYDKDKLLITTFSLLMVFLIYQYRFTIRPDLFSLLFFTLNIYILALHIDKRWAVSALVVIQILWTNMHGFFFFGPLFILIGIVSEWIKRHAKLPWEWNQAGRLNNEEYRRIKMAFFCVILACLVNPQFVQGAWYPISVFFSLSGDSKIFFKYIQELQRPITLDTIWDFHNFGVYKLLIVISFISFVFNRQRLDISALFFWLVFLIFSLIAQRNTPFFAFAAYLVIITNLLHLSADRIIPIRFTGKKFLYITSIAVKLLFLFYILTYCSNIAANAYYDFDNYAFKSEFGGVGQQSVPHKAGDFLVENNIKGNFFNDFNSGSYLVGRTFPNIRVYIDGRTELYGSTFFKEYWDMWKNGDEKLIEKNFAKYQITGVFLNSVKEEIPRGILRYIHQQKEWVPVYFDADGIVFLKDIPENQEVINKFKIDFTHWKTQKIDLLRLGALRVMPHLYNFRAYTLEAMDYDDAAVTEAQEAIRITPGYSDPHRLMGKIYTKRKEFQKAFESFRHAAIINPSNREIRSNLAYTYIDLNEYEGAIKEYNSILKDWPWDVRAKFALSYAFALNHQFDDAYDTLKKAVDADSNSPADVLKVGDSFFNDGQLELAKTVYGLALKSDKEKVKTYTKLSDVYQSLGDKNKAIEELQAALALEPENKDLKSQIEKLK